MGSDWYRMGFWDGLRSARTGWGEDQDRGPDYQEGVKAGKAHYERWERPKQHTSEEG